MVSGGVSGVSWRFIFKALFFFYNLGNPVPFFFFFTLALSGFRASRFLLSRFTSPALCLFFFPLTLFSHQFLPIKETSPLFP